MVVIGVMERGWGDSEREWGGVCGREFKREKKREKAAGGR